MHTWSHFIVSLWSKDQDKVSSLLHQHPELHRQRVGGSGVSEDLKVQQLVPRTQTSDLHPFPHCQGSMLSFSTCFNAYWLFNLKWFSPLSLIFWAWSHHGAYIAWATWLHLSIFLPREHTSTLLASAGHFSAMAVMQTASKSIIPWSLAENKAFVSVPDKGKISVPNFGVRHSEKNREGGTKRSQAGFPDAW